MTVESLNCPNCGAGVASDHTQCEFCRTRLKTMACPSCMGLMFVGSEFCGHCGSKMVRAAQRGGENAGSCPRCETRLEPLQIGVTELRECLRCDGMWADVGTFEHLCTTREERSAVLGFIGNRERHAETMVAISYVPCPDCGQLMNRSNFARASGVIIDVCKKHGVWFDAGELPKIIEFIQKGGMEIAREKERIDIRDERGRLRDEQMRRSRLEQRHGLGDMLEQDDDGLLKFVRKILD